MVDGGAILPVCSQRTHELITIAVSKRKVIGVRNVKRRRDGKTNYTSSYTTTNAKGIVRVGFKMLL